MESRPNPRSPRSGLLSLLLLIPLELSLGKSLSRERGAGAGLIHCGDYTNQVLPDGRCRIVATLPQGDERRCPDLFRCTDEVSFWLHENEERKQQLLELRQLLAELQEELRNHRHRIKALESQVRGREGREGLGVRGGHRIAALHLG
ncbi:hypothetical protein WISP_00215 [Willisornis vidua]|uniref:Uncharacterized protein n=1 Tax=Willisornis vidua TaxID=1566151 RepID=A0ABQ9CKL7_9PASS|nr:hypothetical protein WISP_00215 [Willisornis vidua]